MAQRSTERKMDRPFPKYYFQINCELTASIVAEIHEEATADRFLDRCIELARLELELARHSRDPGSNLLDKNNGAISILYSGKQKKTRE